MAPAYRANTSNRRQNRTGLIDHGEYEGLPIRHWRRDLVVVAPHSHKDTAYQNAQGDLWAVELPHGMPKDSQLLSQHCRDLLKAARSGRIYKRPAAVEEEGIRAEAMLGDKPDKKEEEHKERGFMAKAWKQIPRQQEGADTEYLAKRRKGLLAPGAKAQQANLLTKTTVRRTDAAGNEYVQDFFIAPGQAVEGVIISQTPMHTTEDTRMATPPRRKGPVQKKRLKGPGRGRRKKVEAPTSAPQGPGTQGASSDRVTSNNLRIDGIKNESGPRPDSAKDADTEIVDDSNAGSDDDDGEEGEEDEAIPAATHLPAQQAQRIPTPTTSAEPPARKSPPIDLKDSSIHAAPSEQPDINIKQQLKETKAESSLKQDASLLSRSPTRNPVSSISSLQATNQDASQKAKLISLNTHSKSPLPMRPDFPQTSGVTTCPSLATTVPLDLIKDAQAIMSAPSEVPLMHEVAAGEVAQETEDGEEILFDIIGTAKNTLAGSGEMIEASRAAPAIHALTMEALPEATEFMCTEQDPLQGGYQNPEKSVLVEDFPDLLGGLG